MTPAAAFVPPAYPFDALGELAVAAEAVPGGLVDLSIGTPCDAPPAVVLEALAAPAGVRGYPSSTGSAGLLDAARGYLERRFGVAVERRQVASCIGTKELVAGLPHWLRLRRPELDTVLYPAISYPTYAMGATLAGCRAVPVTSLPGGGTDLESLDEADAERALCLWVNSPANPSGELTDLAAAAAWGRRRGVPVLSDECYSEFSWADRPRSILEHGCDGVLALHSVSKRSNCAGLRVGFYAGDGELVHYIAELRRHAGFMVPGPAQAAATAALGDDSHVEVQRATYLERLELLVHALSSAGLAASLPAGSFYLWIAAGDVGGQPAAEPTHEGADWRLTRQLALAAGILVSPGSFYGEGGAGFVRLAVVQPTERIALAARRLAAVVGAGLPAPAVAASQPGTGAPTTTAARP